MGLRDNLLAYRELEIKMSDEPGSQIGRDTGFKKA